MEMVSTRVVGRLSWERFAPMAVRRTDSGFYLSILFALILAITSCGGASTPGSGSSQLVPPAPTVSMLQPASGPVGASVVVTGTNLTGASALSFNGMAATYTVNSSTQITATVPSGATTGKVSVTTPGGSASSASSGRLTPNSVRLLFAYVI